MSAPLHERIRRDLERRILSGKLAPGARLPTEQDFMADYGCARMTVNKALSALVAAGLIVRRKRAGSFVARPETHSMLLDIPDLERDVRGRGESYEFRISKRAVRKARGASDRALAGEGRIIELAGVHIADGQAFAVEHRLINLSSAPGAETFDWEKQSPGAWLLDNVPWTEAESRVMAINADSETAQALDIPINEACMVIERRTWRGRERITTVRQVFAPGSIDLVARFGPRPTL
jgi:GntR family histidine utilization transcriptional repressor